MAVVVAVAVVISAQNLQKRFCRWSLAFVVFDWTVEGCAFQIAVLVLVVVGGDEISSSGTPLAIHLPAVVSSPPRTPSVNLLAVAGQIGVTFVEVAAVWIVELIEIAYFGEALICLCVVQVWMRRKRGKRMVCLHRVRAEVLASTRFEILRYRTIALQGAKHTEAEESRSQVGTGGTFSEENQCYRHQCGSESPTVFCCLDACF